MVDIALASTARRDPEVRKALKKEQITRLALKQEVIDGKRPATDYSELYAKHPDQVAKRKQQTAERAVRAEARDMAKKLGIANAEAGAELFAAAPTLTSDEGED